MRPCVDVITITDIPMTIIRITNFDGETFRIDSESDKALVDIIIKGLEEHKPEKNFYAADSALVKTYVL